MKKPSRRLTLNRETLRHLDETTLRRLNGQGVVVAYPPHTKAPVCYSPFCVPTFGTNCETQTTV
jgi:hypothetical protein